MSTRAHIGFYDDAKKPLRDWDALIYKHSDGYPEGTLPLLKMFCEAFNKQRGLDDSEYAAARYVARLAAERDEQLAEYRKDKTAMEGFDFVGIGISKRFHGDIEFYYAVYPHEIRVYNLGRDWMLNESTAAKEGEVGHVSTLDGYTFTLEEKVAIK